MKIKSYAEAKKIVDLNRKEITNLIDNDYDIKNLSKEQLEKIILFYSVYYAENLYIMRGEKERSELMKNDIKFRKDLSKKEFDKHIEMCNSIIAKCKKDESDNSESEK